jgi:hypothetical protein
VRKPSGSGTADEDREVRLPGVWSLGLALLRPILCSTMKGLRFGVVSESVREGRGWLDFARQVEDAGINALLLRDHFSAGAFGQQLAPFTGLAAAAAVTTRLRLGTIVLSNDFRHPAVLAHEAASLHLVRQQPFTS